MGDLKKIRISKILAARGKLYAERHKTSLSKLVEDKLLELLNEETPEMRNNVSDDLIFLKGLVKDLDTDQSRWENMESRVLNLN
jgi:hypothetical protein